MGSRARDILALLLERPGELVLKDAIMDAVWSRVAVESNNLSVQIAAIRRILDNGRAKGSYVQTVPGRGYRFAIAVTPAGEATSTLPRLSLAVLPFDNLGGDARDDYLADAVTDDLTTNLSRLPGALVIARTSADSYRGKSVDVRRVGQELGVRYVVEGSTQRLGNILRVNVQLVSTETGAHLWAERFDQNISDLRAGQDEIVSRLSAELGVQVTVVESARSVRERPHDPDAFDFFLRARSAFRNQSTQSIALYEQALQLDPASARIKILLARELINRYFDGPDVGKLELTDRAGTLISAAAATEPTSEHVIFAQGFLLRAQARFAEAIALLEHLVERAPNNSNAFRQLGICKIAKGLAGDALPLLLRSIRLDPVSPNHRFTCYHIGWALALLGRDAEAIAWQQRALAADLEVILALRANCYLTMAIAYAHLGHTSDARYAVTKAYQLGSHATVRSYAPVASPVGLPDPTLLVQMHRILEGLRLAGVRDHAEEAAEFGVPATGELCAGFVGSTPTSVPGATTVRTGELVDLMARQKPILIDVAWHSRGRSIPGTVGLQGTGHGGRFSDERQTRFSRKMQHLTGGDLAVPIVAFCANSERFTGYNLALRLVELGYSRIYWYRGGFEAWQVNGLLDAELTLLDW
jgi:TolB-like protein